MIDEDGDGLISFREFAQGLGIICKGETQDRMQFMYRMHVPPAINDDSLDISDAESVESCAELEESGISEDLTSPSCEESQPHGISQSRAIRVPEEKPISISSKARDVHEPKIICENTEDSDKRGTEIPPMSQVKRNVDKFELFTHSGNSKNSLAFGRYLSCLCTFNVRELEHATFLATDGNRKRADFPFNMSSQCHIYIVKYLFSSKDDLFENLSGRDHCPGIRNVHFRFPSVTQKGCLLKLSILISRNTSLCCGKRCTRSFVSYQMSRKCTNRSLQSVTCY